MKSVMELVDGLRNDGHSWKSIAKEVEKQLGVKYKADSLRIEYNYRYDASENQVELMKKTRKSSIKARSLRNSLNKTIDAKINLDGVMSEIKHVISKKVKKAKVTPVKVKSTGDKMTIEMLFSDLQIGKLMDGYDSKIAEKRIEEYARASIFKIKQYISMGYNVEKILLAFLGDITESSEKHKNSARATDMSTPAQVANAIQILDAKLLSPLSQLGIKMEVVCVTGNHDWDGHGLNMYNPGIEHNSCILYNSLRLLSEAKGYKHVSYTIPYGVFAVSEIYDHKLLYEHGVGVGCNEKSMKDKLASRSTQLKEFITYFRMGDKHNISRFNNDRYVVNGAFFGGDMTGSEYSSIVGYDSNAAQIMFSHVKRKKNDARLPIYESFVIQLQHIK